jgi:DUF1009 family protein
MAKLALIAGGNALPELVAESCRKQNKEIFVAALRGFADPRWVEQYPHVWLKLGQVGKLFKALKDNHCREVVMAGTVARPAWSQVWPDWECLKLLWQLKKQARGDDALLRFLGRVFEDRGYRLIGADDLLPESLMPNGVMTQTKPTDADYKDIAYAMPFLTQWASADQGQAIVVQQGLILGVEALEGTDELITRCGGYKRGGRGPILIKIKKPQQDRRLDLPNIGEETVRRAIEAGFSGIAVEAGQALFLKPSAAIALADKHGLFIAGIDAA